MKIKSQQTHLEFKQKPLEAYREPTGELFMLVVLFVTVTGLLMHFHFEQQLQQREVAQQMDPTGYADPKGITRNQTPALGL